MASTYLSRASGTPTSTKKFTISFWVKKCGQGADQFLVSSFTDANNRMQVNFNTDDRVDFIAKVSGSNIIRKQPTRQLRDPSSFYHILVAVDTTLGTAADRCKIYINGSQESVFTYETNPSQNADANVSGDHFIGAYDNGGSPALFFDGLMTHIHYTDGYTYAASDFGETDSTSGIWKPKTSPNVTYGSNGFFLKFENSGAMGTDSSGNTNTFTTGGTLTQNTNTPSNVFTTLNPLDNPYPGQKATFSNANLTGAGTETGFLAGATSFGLSSGKWYSEFKVTGGTTSFQVFGVLKSPVGNLGTSAPHDSANFYGVRGVGTKIQPGGGGGETASWAGTWATNDIISLALDCDNNRLYVAKNGQYADGSGNYDEAFTGSPAYLTLASDETYHLMGASISTGSGVSLTMQANFGSGFFGTTAVASANSDGNGFGAFEYAVPSGYYALCTKNIKEFG